MTVGKDFYMNCKVCGISWRTRKVYPQFDWLCSPCFAWQFNYIEHMLPQCKDILDKIRKEPNATSTNYTRR